MPSGISPTSPQPFRDDLSSDRRQARYEASKQYLEIMGAMEILSQINTQTKHLQKQELAQSRRGAPAKSELTASSAPTSSTGGQVALQDMKIELDALKSMLAFLEKKLPGNPDVAKFAAALDKIAKDYPNLTSDDVKNLNQLVGELLPFVQKMGTGKKLSTDDINTFLKQLSDMYSAMTESNNQAISAWKKAYAEEEAGAKAEAKAKSQLFGDVAKDLSTINSILSYMEGEGNKLDNEQKITQLLAAVTDLIKNYASLPPAQKKEADKVLADLNSLKAGTTYGESFNGTSPKLFATLQVAQWTQDYAAQCKAQGTTPTVAGAQAYIKKQLATIPDSDNAFIKNMKANILAYTNNANFPATSGDVNPPAVGDPSLNFGSAKDGTLVPNTSYFSTMAQSWAINFDPYALSSDVSAAANSFSAAAKNPETPAGDEAAATGKLIAQFEGINKSIGVDQGKVQNASFANNSLPVDFYNAILGNYMPSQENYLMQLAAELFFSNTGTQMTNQQLNDIMGWSDSSGNYDLSSWLNTHQNSDGSYSGTKKSAKSHIKGEEDQANGDIKQAQNALDDITKQLAQVAKLLREGKLTKKQAGTLTKQLTTTQGNLKQAIINLNQLVSDLKTAYGDVEGKGSSFTLPTADATAIQTDENIVVKGTPADGGSGLENIQTTLSNNETSWSGQSQQQQINLQMKMTEIQQEWTVVSTSLQLLNQMYMTLAKSLYQ